MLLLIYYVTLFYFSVFCLNILDKCNKKELKNLDDLKIYLLNKTFTIISKFYKVKRLTMNTYNKYLTINDSTAGIPLKHFLHIFSKNKKMKMSIDNNEIIMDDDIDVSNEELTIYIECDSFLKEIKSSLKEVLDTNISETIEQITNDIKDKKLFLNVELVNGKLKNSDTIDLTSEIQKYFIEGNTILSMKFIKTILKHNMGIELDKDYSVNIMTKDVEMFILKNTQKINIKRNIKDNVLDYEIVTNDDVN
jgi:hypothetical protein